MSPALPVYALNAVSVANVIVGAILVNSVRQGDRLVGYALGVVGAICFMINLDNLRQMREKGWIK